MPWLRHCLRHASPLRNPHQYASMRIAAEARIAPDIHYIDEVARVLEPGGRFILLLCHPLLQAPGSAWIDDRILGEMYWRVGAYLGDERRFGPELVGEERGRVDLGGARGPEQHRGRGREPHLAALCLDADRRSEEHTSELSHT